MKKSLAAMAALFTAAILITSLGASSRNLGAVPGLAPAGGHQVSLTCSAPSGGGTVTGYNFLRGTVSGGPYTQLVPGTNSTCSYVDTQSLVEGTTYYYVAQATGPGGVSGNSNQASATVPFLPPGIPQGLSAAAQ